MRQFMDHVQAAFYEATGWSHDSSYSALNATSDALLAFPTPRGVRLSLSSLATPHFATSYQLGSVGVVDGSVSYLFSSVPLAAHMTAPSARVPLGKLSRAYRPLTELPRSGPWLSEGPPPTATTPPHDIPSALPRLGLPRNPTLLYGRLYLPTSLLEALFVSRLSKSFQMRLSAVSSPTLKNGGTVLGVAQYDVGRFALEGLASSDGGLMGLRGAYNFGGDLDNPLGPSCKDAHDAQGSEHAGDTQQVERERIYGRFTAGGEIYYGTLNKSGGISVGARFATLPAHKGTPLTATLTINPLMGSIAATYAVIAGKQCSLATRFDFNVYSYDSHWSAGVELWRKGAPRGVDGGQDSVAEGGGLANKALDVKAVLAEKSVPETPQKPTRSFQAKMEWRLDPIKVVESSLVPSPPAGPVAVVETPPATTPTKPKVVRRKRGETPVKGSVEAPKAAAQVPVETPNPQQDNEERYNGVLKARLDQTLKLGVIWEGRVKSLLYSIGSGIDLRKPDQPFRTLGLEIQFSS